MRPGDFNATPPVFILEINISSLLMSFMVLNMTFTIINNERYCQIIRRIIHLI